MRATKGESEAMASDLDDGPILVVDDEPGVRRILCRLLTKMGLQVNEAASGIEAAAAVSANEHALIISDIAMPGMDGMALLREVRKHDHDVPVILVTGKPSFESAVAAIEYGAFHYFVKPFSNDEFRTVVVRALQYSRIAKAKRRALSLMGSHNPPPGDMAGLVASSESAVENAWMAFQPIVRSSGDHGAYGFEALLRSEEPTLPNPGAVLAAAERLDRLTELGRVLRKRAAEPYLDRDDDLCLFVNLHPQDLMDSELDDPKSPLCKVASRVVLEVTERASLANLEDVRSRVMDLRAVGFRIAVDDLGAGYSGLTSLATLQPEIVKIDMSLIRGVDRDTTRQRLIGSLTQASQDMGILVVAEGIETAAERDAIVGLGCDLMQGYLFGRPGRAFPEHGW